jgi:hypothetical protein
MLSKFDSHCAQCGGAIKAGEEIHYVKTNPRGKRAYHPACWAEKAQQHPQPAPQQPQGNPSHVPLAKLEGRFGRTVRARFDGLSSLMAYVTQPWPFAEDFGLARSIYERNLNTQADRPEWYGMNPADTLSPCRKAQQMATDGWPEGVEMFQSLRESLPDLPAPVSAKRRRIRAEFGDALDMPRVWRGDLEHAWERCSRQSSRATAPITIAMHFGCPSSTSGETLQWRAVAAVVLADALQAAGYSVQILAYWKEEYSENSSYTCDWRMTVKAFTAPLDIASTVASMSIPAIRGASYAAYCLMGAECGIHVGSGITNGHGENDESIDEEFGKVIHLDTHAATDKQKAEKFIKSALAPFCADPLALAA